MLLNHLNLRLSQKKLFNWIYRKYFIVSRAYSNFLTFILRAYFQMCLLFRGRTLKFLELKISQKDEEHLNQLDLNEFVIEID